MKKLDRGGCRTRPDRPIRMEGFALKDDRQTFIRSELRRLRLQDQRADRRSWRMLWFGTLVVGGALSWLLYSRLW